MTERLSPRMQKVLGAFVSLASFAAVTVISQGSTLTIMICALGTGVLLLAADFARRT